jgi:hypothetical protein
MHAPPTPHIFRSDKYLADYTRGMTCKDALLSSSDLLPHFRKLPDLKFLRVVVLLFLHAGRLHAQANEVTCCSFALLALPEGETLGCCRESCTCVWGCDIVEPYRHSGG